MGTLYDLLRVPSDSSQPQIEAAYRRLVEELGPERPENLHNPDVEIRFKSIREAFLILSDRDRRDAYDARLAAKMATGGSVDAKVKRGWTPTTVVLTVLLGVVLVSAVGQIFVQWQAVRTAREVALRADAERLALEMQERKLNEGPDQEALALREKYEQQRAAEKAEREARIEEERRQRQIESDRRYSEQVSRDLRRGQEQAAREEAKRLAEIDRQLAEAERKRKEEDAAALRRLAEEKRKADRLERERLYK